MPIEDVFSIKGRGTVGTGRIERGQCKVGDTIEIVGLKPNKSTVVTGIEAFNLGLPRMRCILRRRHETSARVVYLRHFDMTGLRLP